MLLIKRKEQAIDDIQNKKCMIDTFKVEEIKTKEDVFKFMITVYDLYLKDFNNLEKLEVSINESYEADKTNHHEILDKMPSYFEMTTKYLSWKLEVIHIFSYYMHDGVSIMWNFKDNAFVIIYPSENKYKFMKFEDTIDLKIKELFK